MQSLALVMTTQHKWKNTPKTQNKHQNKLIQALLDWVVHYKFIYVCMYVNKLALGNKNTQRNPKVNV